MYRLAGEAQAARQPDIRDCIFGIQVYGSERVAVFGYRPGSIDQFEPLEMLGLWDG